MDDKVKEWITVKGNHIPIKEGQTVKEAIAERFDYEDEEINIETDDLDKNIESNRYKIKEASMDKLNNSPGFIQKDYTKSIVDMGTITGTKQNIEELRNMLNSRTIYDADLEKVMAYNIRRNRMLWGIVVRKNGDNYYNDHNRELHIGFNANSSITVNVAYLNHEIGHSLDCKGVNKFRSSTFISSKYGKTLSDMVESELKQNISNEDLNNLINTAEVDKELWYEEFKNNRTKEMQEQYDTVWLNYQDQLVTLEAVFGPKRGKLNIYGKNYWDDNGLNKGINRGTELFAMITEARTSYKPDGIYMKWLKKVAPKSLEIYDEIIEDYIKNEVM